MRVEEQLEFGTDGTGGIGQLFGVENQKRASFLPKMWELPTTIRKRLGTDVGRQRLMDEDGHLLLILHEVPRPEDDEKRRAFVLWGDSEGNWKSSPEKGGLAGLDAHLSSYSRAIHDLDDDVEAALTPRDYFEVMKRAHPLLRATRNLLAVLESVRKARPEERRLIVARDRAIDLERGIDLATGDAKAGMEFSMAVNAEAQARAANSASREARRLNRLAAFFFPLATLVAVFGINPPTDVLQMPGFLVVIAIGVLAGVGTVLVISGSEK